MLIPVPGGPKINITCPARIHHLSFKSHDPFCEIPKNPQHIHPNPQNALFLHFLVSTKVQPYSSDSEAPNPKPQTPNRQPQQGFYGFPVWRFVKSKSSRSLRSMEEAMSEREEFTLVVRKPCFGLPTACPTCLPLYFYLKFANLPFNLDFNLTYPDSGKFSIFGCLLFFFFFLFVSPFNFDLGVVLFQVLIFVGKHWN